MKNDFVKGNIDGIITNKIVDKSFEEIISEISLRANALYRSLERNEEEANIFSRILLGLDKVDEKTPTKVKYVYKYVIFAEKRIEDLKWIISNQNKFVNYSKLNLFKLILFREKIGIENSKRK